MPSSDEPRPSTPRVGKQAAAGQRIAAKRAAEQARAEVQRRRRRRRTGAWVAAAVVVIAVLAAVAVQTSRTATDTTAASPRSTAAGTDGAGFATGEEAAPVVIDLYEDFLCPVCRQFEQQSGDTLDQLVQEGTVRVRYRPIAILDRLSPDDYSTRALNAAAVVADEAGADAFLTFHDTLFAHQPAEGGPGLTDEQLISLAADAGASGPRVEEGIRDLRFEGWTARVTDQASKNGITGTPTALVDGTALTDRSPAGITAAVRAATAQR